MTAAGLLLAFIVVFTAGAGLTRLLGGTEREFQRAEFHALSFVLGAGYVSLGLWLFGMALSGLALLGAVIIGAMVLGFLGRTARCQFARHEQLRELDWLLLSALLVQALFIIWWAPRVALGWDGLMIWEFKARVAIESGGVIPAAYFADADRAWSHPNYPLGLPGLETWLQLCLGRVDQAWVRLPGPLYYFAGAALVVAGTQRLGGTRRTGLAAAVAFFFVPYFFAGTWGVLSGYADFPLGVLFLAALIYLPRQSSSSSDAALCGTLAALLIWQKSEGRVLWLTIGVLAGGTMLVRKEWRGWLAVALPGAALAAGFALFLASRHTIPEADFPATTFAAVLAHADRIGPILSRLASELGSLENWGLLWAGTGFALAALGVRRELRRAAEFTAALLFPLAAYVLAFVLSGWTDFRLHMDLALPRLLLQLAPTSVLIIAVAVPRTFSLAKRAPTNEDQQP
jgi:hypothetical protein